MPNWKLEKKSITTPLLRVHGRTCQGRRLNLVETKFRLPVDEIFSLLLEDLRMHEADSALKSSVTGAPSHSKTVFRSEKMSKRPRGQDDTAVRAPAHPPPQPLTPAPPAPLPQEVRAAAPAKSSNSKPSKPWQDPDPDIAFTPDKNFKGCWWCHR